MSCGGKRAGAGRPRVTEPRTVCSTQRYTKAEENLLRSVAGGARLCDFIRDAAVDRARLFAEQAEEGAVPLPPDPPPKRVIREGCAS